MSEWPPLDLESFRELSMALGDTPVTNQEILDRLRQQQTDEDAWRTFFGSYQPVLFRWARRKGLSESDADELTARVLQRLVELMRHQEAQQRFQYDPQRGRFRGFLRTLLSHAIVDYVREKNRLVTPPGTGDSTFGEMLAQHPDPHDPADVAAELEEQWEQDWQRFQQALQSTRAIVSAKDWDAFRLTTLEGRPVTEAAAELGLSLSVVYNARYKVKHALREQCQQLGLKWG
jgi:RNA polymerase sigma-70 factor (ECF subfamily)